MMALADSLVDQAGTAWPMAGLLPGCGTMQARLAGLGSQGLQTAQGELRGHTFHYSRFDSLLTPAAHTIKPASGVAGEALYRSGSLTASYFHTYFPPCPAAAAAAALLDSGGAP
jgi:cobyrinic acid a,c-diamide synthase